jgi:hypothetical protein
MSVFSLRTLGAAFVFATFALPASAEPLEVGTHPDSITVGSKKIPIPLPPPTGKRESGTHTIPIGDGKKVVHVKIEQAGATWEAIVAGGANDPLFAGLTGFTQGEEGERSGHVVLITDRDAESKFVLIGDVREDTRICGQAMTPLSVRGLDPRTMTFRGASMHRIDKKERDAATAITAAATTAKPPLARLLSGSGASSGKAPAITDGQASTAWTAERPGDGHGEFVTMRAPIETPLHSLLITTHGDGPKTLFVATEKALFRVSLPDAKGTQEVTFPQPIATSCVSIVLDEAYGDGVPPIDEVEARTKFDVDGASLDDVVKELSGARAEEAAAVLRRGGDKALAAVTTAWPKLDGKARSFAVDVASSTGTCNGPAMELLTTALADADREVRRRSLGRIERCGKNAAGSLIVAVQSPDEPRRAASAGLLAAIAPKIAFDPLVSVLGQGKAETRHAVRAALGKAAAIAPADELRLALASTKAPLELLRALGTKALEIKPEAEAALNAILAGTPDFATRYLAVEPLGAIADHERLSAMAKSDPEWPVRMHAVEMLGTGAPASAASDPEPRVREAALRSLAAPAPAALAHDEWPFVRVAAAEGMGTRHEHPEALAAALADPNAKVRAAAVRALGAANARQYGEKLRERLDDQKEDTEVRALSARTLGELCIASAADKLTRLAILAAHPVDEADERLGMAALDGLAALHPADIEKRLAPLRVKGSKTLLTRAADRAVTEPGTCHR